MKPYHLLTIGHSYVVAINRAIVRDLAVNHNVKVTVVAPRRFHGSLRTIEIEPEPTDSPLEVISVDAYLTQKMHVFFYNNRQLKKIFKQIDYDVAHFWEEPYILAGYQLGRIAKNNKAPFCFRTAQSLIKNYVFPFSKFEKQMFTWCNRWIAGGNLVHKAMQDKGWSSEKGKVITLAVDTKRFRSFSDMEKQKVVKELGLQSPVMVYMGRLTEEKGLDMLMNIVGRLDKAKPWSFLLLGSGVYKQKIENWRKANGLEDRVQVKLLTHDEVPGVLPACNFMVCPSQTRPFWKEQFGRMLVEAFASKLAVLGSDSGEIPFVIDKSGIVIGETDELGWEKEINRMISDPEQCEKMANLGLARCERYTSSAVAKNYFEFYQDMIDRP